MQKGYQQKNNEYGFLGKPTQAKASGGAFTLGLLMSAVLSIILSVALSAFGLAENENLDKTDWYLYCTYLLTPIAIFIILCLYLGFLKKPFAAMLKEQKCAAKYYFVAILLQIGLFSLSFLTNVFLSVLGKWGYVAPEIVLPSMDGFGFIGVLFVVAILPAVFEEILFRGMILKGTRVFGTAGAALLCGGLFALFHQNPAQTVYQFCCGAGFALVALRSGSILPTVLSHFINNALILTLEKLGYTTFSAPVTVVIIVLSAICLLLALWYLIFKDKNVGETRYADSEKKAERKNFFIFAAAGLVLCILSWVLSLVNGF